MNSVLSSKTNRGFSLLELMIVLVIIAIISSIALPSYLGYVLKSKRTEGQVTLMELSQQLERCFTEGSSFNGASCPAGPVDSENGYYTVTVNAAATSYTLTAAPTFEDTECGSLTLTQTGSKGSSAGGDCW